MKVRTFMFFYLWCVGYFKAWQSIEDLYLLGRGDFQKNFTIFLAFVPNAPMTIRFILVPLKMFVSIRKTLHADPILREQPNLNHNKDKINFHFVLFFSFHNRNLLNDH